MEPGGSDPGAQGAEGPHPVRPPQGSLPIREGQSAPASPGQPRPRGLGSACRFCKSPPLTELQAPPQRGFVWNLKHLLKLMNKNVRCVHS